MEKAYRGYFIGSHKMHGLWFAYGWVPEAGRSRIVFVDEVTSREEAERRVREEVERLLNLPA